MPLSPVSPGDLTKVAVGIDRPEDVVVGPDGRVFASDHQCAVAEIFPDGSFKRMGPKGGAPNGINMDRQGRVLIANFGIYDREDGPLQRFDPASGEHETLATEIDGRRLTSANYPVIDRAGNIWCANSTHAETWPQALDGRTDGFIFVLRPDGSSDVVAEGLKFPNGIALSADERYLFCAQTSGGDVMRFPVHEGGKLGAGDAMARSSASCSRQALGSITTILAIPTGSGWTPRATSGSACRPPTRSWRSRPNWRW